MFSALIKYASGVFIYRGFDCCLSFLPFAAWKKWFPFIGQCLLLICSSWVAFSGLSFRVLQVPSLTSQQNVWHVQQNTVLMDVNRTDLYKSKTLLFGLGFFFFFFVLKPNVHPYRFHIIIIIHVNNVFVLILCV